MTRPALIAADALFAHAGLLRGAEHDDEESDLAGDVIGSEATLDASRAAAVSALRALPPASVEHPYPRITVIRSCAAVLPPLLAQCIEAEWGVDLCHVEALEDYADALRVWDREEQEMGDGEKAGAE